MKPLFRSRRHGPPRSYVSLLRLTAASSNFGLHLLTKTPDVDEDIFPFGGGLSGHQAFVNDMTFCGGPTDDTARYVATVSGVCRPVHPSRTSSSLNYLASSTQQ